MEDRNKQKYRNLVNRSERQELTDGYLKKRSYKDTAIENLQKRKVEELKVKEKIEKYKQKFKKQQKLSRFQEISKNRQSRWDTDERSDFFRKKIFKKEEKKKEEILNPNLSNWDKQDDDSEGNIKINQETPNTLMTDQQHVPSKTLLNSLTPQQLELYQKQMEIQKRNRYLTDKELDDVLPAEGFEILKPPEDYKPIKISRNINKSSVFGDNDQNGQHYMIPESNVLGDELPAMTQNDLKFFGDLLKKSKNKLTPIENKERKVLSLLLKVKNGTSQIRKMAMKTITEKARDYGAELLLGRILPLLMDSSLDSFERHLIVKVLDRVIFKLKELIKPYLQKILVVIMPMLIDEDYLVRIEGREIISNLSKAAGLSALIISIRSDIDNPNDDIRDVTAQTFAVGATSLTIPKLLPFIKAVCRSKKKWEARHTGCKIIFHIAKLMACGILPHLKGLVDAVSLCLKDQNRKVKIAAA